MDQQPVLEVCREVELQLGLANMLAKPLENHLSQRCPLGALQCPSSSFLSGASQLLAEGLNFYGASILLLLVLMYVLVERVSRVMIHGCLCLYLMMRELVKRPTCSRQSRVSFSASGSRNMYFLVYSGNTKLDWSQPQLWC